MTDPLLLVRRLDLVIVKKKKKKKKKNNRTRRIVDVSVPAGHRVKSKESEKRDEYQDIAWELKKLLDMKMAAMPIVIGMFSNVAKGLSQWLAVLEIRGRLETIQNIALVGSATILKRVQETWESLLLVRFQWKVIS